MDESGETETDEAFLLRLQRLGEDWRFSDEFIVGLVVRARYPREWPRGRRKRDSAIDSHVERISEQERRSWAEDLSREFGLDDLG